jgi:hypothetical protein
MVAGWNIDETISAITIPFETGIACEARTTQLDCESNGCYWYNNSCHTLPQTPTEKKAFPWWIALLVPGAATFGFLAYLFAKKKKKK